jgi:hypothetical protein
MGERSGEYFVLMDSLLNPLQSDILFCVDQSINQSINTLLTCCSLTSGVMAMQALPPAEARVIQTPEPRVKQ